MQTEPISKITNKKKDKALQYQNGCWQYPQSPRINLPNLSAQAQKFEISMKKSFIGRP